MVANSSGRRTFANSILLVALCALPAAGGPFTSLVVFGDSLSDVGNINAVTPFFAKYPGPYYYQGRFSNGPVWVESLVTGLGLPPITRSTAGGNDFAYGGAQTAGTVGIDGFYIDDVNEQVTSFLPRTTDPTALYVVYAGANDFDNDQTNANVPVNNLAAQLDRLIADGARKFLIPNLPPLGLTPKYSGSATTASQLNARSIGFNSALSTMLDNLAASNAALTIHRLDVAGLIQHAIASPGAFNLINVTQSAAPGLEPGTSSYNTSLIVSQPNKYLFWDNLHPTTAVHSILAQQAVDLLLRLPGDYNTDHQVDAADYTVWRNSVGVSGAGLAADGNRDGLVDRADFNLWKTHFGQATGAGALATSSGSVPEPNGVFLAMLGVLLALTKVRQRFVLLSSCHALRGNELTEI